MEPEILAKLTSLLRIKAERGATEAEVANALSLAQRLALKHRIRLEDIVVTEADSTVKEAMTEKQLQSDKGPFRRSPCNKYVVQILMHFFAVEVIYTDHGRTLNLIGRQSDVEFGLYVYGFLKEEFNRLWRRERRAKNLSMADRASFFYGLYLSLSAKLRESQGEAFKEEIKELGVDTGRYKLALVDEEDRRKQFQKDRHPLLVTVKCDLDANVRYTDVFASGLKQGNDITIHRALK